MSELVAIDGDNFIAEVLDVDRPVILDCWAAWCGPCLKLGPELEALSAQEGHRLKIAKLDCDENQGIAQLLGVQVLPTMVLFVDGVVEASLTGYRTKDAILAAFKPFLKTKKWSEAGG